MRVIVKKNKQLETKKELAVLSLIESLVNGDKETASQIVKEMVDRSIRVRSNRILKSETLI